jgi:O-antigen ligase
VSNFKKSPVASDHLNSLAYPARKNSALVFGIWSPLVILLVGYSILNRGFAYIGFYPIFIGEIAIIFYLVAIVHSRVFPVFFKTPLGLAWTIFFVFNFALFVVAAFSDFSEAIRNSVYWVYTVFLYFGFAFGRFMTRNKLEYRFSKLLFVVSVLTLAYYLLFPMRVELKNFTAFLSGGGVSLLGYYSSLHALSVGFVFFAMFHKSKYSTLVLTLGLLLIVFASQSRASIVAVMAIVAYLIVQERKKSSLRVFGVLIFISALAMPIVFAMNFEIAGQRGAVNFEFVNTMFSSIFSSSGVDSLDGTRADRLLWWRDVINRTVAENSTLLFGLGVDTILVDRPTGPGTILRYPHNSFVSVFGFSGAIGFMLYLMLLFIPFCVCTVRKAARTKHPVVAWYPVFFLGYIFAAFFSTVFEAPFHSAVFWIITGVSYSYSSYSQSNRINITNNGLVS